MRTKKNCPFSFIQSDKIVWTFEIKSEKNLWREKNRRQIFLVDRLIFQRQFKICARIFGHQPWQLRSDCELFSFLFQTFPSQWNSKTVKTSFDEPIRGLCFFILVLIISGIIYGTDSPYREKARCERSSKAVD